MSLKNEIEEQCEMLRDQLEQSRRECRLALELAIASIQREVDRMKEGFPTTDVDGNLLCGSSDLAQAQRTVYRMRELGGKLLVLERLERLGDN